MTNEIVAIDEANEIAKFRNGINETHEEVCEEMRSFGNQPPPMFAWRDLAERAEAAHNRELTANTDKLRACNLILNSQVKELERRLNSARTAIREVQDRMNHDGTSVGVYNSYWKILEKGFNGEYRNV